jgi:hypothetical protein
MFSTSQNYFYHTFVVSTGYYCHNQYKHDYLRPVPTIYVLVPCSVMGPGLQHNTRIIRDESLETDGIVAAMVTYSFNITTQHIYYFRLRDTSPVQMISY